MNSSARMRTHALCERCWNDREPDRKIDSRQTGAIEDARQCCACGLATWSGIFVRDRVDAMPHCDCEE